jgi:hypothetical protein
MRRIAAARVSFPARDTRKTSGCSRLTEPPTNSLPVRFSTGTDSPVSIDSSALDAPSSTTPSAGIRSPGATSAKSPGTSSCAVIFSPCSASDGVRSRNANAGIQRSKGSSARSARARVDASAPRAASSRKTSIAIESK